MNENENATTQELDNPGATPETGANGPADSEVKASDLLKLLNPDEESEPETDAEETPEPAAEEADEADEDDETAEDEEEEDEPDVPSLDAQIQDALKDNPELTKRWDNQWKGLLKREQKQAEWEEGVTSLFTDREYAREAVPAFLQKLAAVHGTTIEELLGGASNELQPPNPEDFTDYDSQIDATRQYLESKQERELRQLREQIEAMKSQQDQQFKQAEQDKALERALGHAQKVFEKEYAGFKVTRKMLAEAAEKFPNLSPVDALKAGNVDKLTAHMQKVAVERVRVTAPTMPKGGVGRGQTLPDGDKLKARDLLQMLND